MCSKIDVAYRLEVGVRVIIIVARVMDVIVAVVVVVFTVNFSDSCPSSYSKPCHFIKPRSNLNL
jgi:hypothetical protein